MLKVLLKLWGIRRISQSGAANLINIKSNDITTESWAVVIFSDDDHICNYTLNIKSYLCN